MVVTIFGHMKVLKVELDSVFVTYNYSDGNVREYTCQEYTCILYHME